MSFFRSVIAGNRPRRCARCHPCEASRRCRARRASPPRRGSSSNTVSLRTRSSPSPSNEPRSPGAGADGAEAVPAREAERAGGRALGQPVALENQQVEGVEELADLGESGAPPDRAACGRRSAPSPSVKTSRSASRRRRERAGRDDRPGGGGSPPGRRAAPTRRASGGARSPRRSGRGRRHAPSRTPAALGKMVGRTSTRASRRAAGRGGARGEARVGRLEVLSRPKLCASGR